MSDRSVRDVRSSPARRREAARKVGRAVTVLPFAALLPFATPAWADGAVEPVIASVIAAPPVDLPIRAAGVEISVPAVTTPGVSAGIELSSQQGWSLAEPSASSLDASDEQAPSPDQPQHGTVPYGPADRTIAAGDGANGSVSFGDRLGAVKWETLGLAAYLTAINLPGLLKHSSDFDFEDEGLFGDGTANLGMDKVAHAYNAYVLSDILYWRMRRKTGRSAASALASSAIAVGLDVYAELFDGFEERSGFAFSDVGFNVLGAGFSFVRNTVPGLRDKLDFRLLIIPNHDIYSINNKKEHFRQERFLLALKLSGFSGLERSPLRFLELHAGYYARGFTDRERARGAPLERKPFVGIGINLQELLFPRSRSTIARVARTGLEYLQVPYTAVHID